MPDKKPPKPPAPKPVGKPSPPKPETARTQRAPGEHYSAGETRPVAESVELPKPRPKPGGAKDEGGKPD